MISLGLLRGVEIRVDEDGEPHYWALYADVWHEVNEITFRILNRAGPPEPSGEAPK